MDVLVWAILNFFLLISHYRLQNSTEKQDTERNYKNKKDFFNKIAKYVEFFNAEVVISFILETCIITFTSDLASWIFSFPNICLNGLRTIISDGYRCGIVSKRQIQWYFNEPCRLKIVWIRRWFQNMTFFWDTLYKCLLSLDKKKCINERSSYIRSKKLASY